MKDEADYYGRWPTLGTSWQ